MDELLKEYAERFGDGFPSYQIMRGRSDEETMEIIRECLEKGKDAYELGYVEDDDDIMY